MHKIFHCSNGHQIAYNQIPGKSPGIIFLGGFMSDMQGTKATYLESFCKEIGHAFIRFDYTGHGSSSGNLIEGTIGHWKNDVLAVLDNLVEGPQIVVGSSMGGWLMILAALERPTQIAGLVGIASAPDFTKEFNQLPLELQEDLEKKGICYVPSRSGENVYPITRQFLMDGINHHVLEGTIPIECPVHLLHGMQDDIVHWQSSVDLANCLVSNTVTVTLIKDGTHRLARDSDLVCLRQAVKRVLSD